MKFYDAMQLDPAALKKQIRQAESKKEKRWFVKALIARDVLLVAFAIFFISAFSALFGQENSCMAVILFCILLSIRFVDFGYNIRHSLLNLAVVFAILTVSPVLMQHVGAVSGFFINLISLTAVLVMTCERPEMGNGGLYLFGYIFLSGNPVTGDLLFWRGLMAAVGFVLCGGVLFVRHRHKHGERSFLHVVRGFQIHDPKCQWQLRLAFGLSLLFLADRALHLNRFMWAGFACSSLLSAYPVHLPSRMVKRAGGAILGSLLFAAVYQLIPPSMTFLIGPTAGLCLGLCSGYFSKSVLNCFGALLMAAETYGLEGAVTIRIFNNLSGVLFGFMFFFFFDRVMDGLKPLFPRRDGAGEVQNG